MDGLNTLKTNNHIASRHSAMFKASSTYSPSNVNHKNNLTPNLSNYDEFRGFLEKPSQPYDIADYNEPGAFNLVHDEYDEGVNVNSAGRKFPQKFAFPKFQTNYFDEDYAIDYEDRNQDYNQIVQSHYGRKPHIPSPKQPSNAQKKRQNVQPVLRKSRPRVYSTPKRKYHQQSTIHESLNRYDPWKDIYQQGVFDRHVDKYPIRNTSSSSSLKSFTSHAPEKEDKGNADTKGYQVMASNLLYKTKASEASSHEETDYPITSAGGRSDTVGSRNKVGHPNLEEESQFAANFQQQHHRFRWGQGGGNGQTHHNKNQFENPSLMYNNKKFYNRRQPSFFNEKSDGRYQSPELKTFSTTSREDFYDYDDPLAYNYDDMDQYMIDEEKRKVPMRDTAIEKVAHVLGFDYDDYDYGQTYEMQTKPTGSGFGTGVGDTITKRISDVVFSPTVATIFGVVALPLILAAFYWLFVVNGPTPVVKARLDHLLGIATEDGTNENEASLGFNNFVNDGDGGVSYTTVTPLWDAIGKPIFDRLISLWASIGSIYTTAPQSEDGGFINNEPLFSGIFENNVLQ